MNGKGGAGVMIRPGCHGIKLTPLHAVAVPSCASNTDVMHENGTIS